MLTIWDLNSFDVLTEPDFYGLSEPATSRDWNTIATCSRDPGAEVYAVQLWDRRGRPLATIRQQDPVFALAISHDGELLAAGSWNGEIQVWDLAKREQLLPTLKGHTGIVYSVDFSPDGHRLASASRDRTVRLWDLATGDEMITLRGHRRRVRSVAFSSDGRTLASASDDNVVKLWRAASTEEVRNSDW